jgi:N-acetyldiaminopimelate deacetylase
MFDPVLLRHALHQIPELAFEEYETHRLLISHLEDMLSANDSFRIIRFMTSQGILVEYRGAGIEAGFKLFRADMDALPTVEKTNCGFVSIHPGMMHACGHDVHMAVLMGLIHRVLRQSPKQNLLFLFQPAEEGKGGAQSIIAENVLQTYDIRAAFALHVGSEMPVGSISSKAGIFFGIPQEFDVKFIGKAAHVAFPEKGINALACGMQFYREINAGIAKLAEQERVIFHVGKMSAGQIRNIIADECLLEGTHRSLDSGVRDAINMLIKSYAERVAGQYGAQCEVQLLGSYDPVVNDTALELNLQEVCAELDYQYIPAETVMTGEDFGFFTSMYPGLLFWLGSGNGHPLHSGSFLPADECIAVGIDLMWGLALK